MERDFCYAGLKWAILPLVYPILLKNTCIQKWVGHRDLDTTLRIYAKVKEKEAKREILDKMKEIIPLKKYKEE